MTRIAIISDIHFGKFSRTLDFVVPGETVQDQSKDVVPFEEGLIALLKEMKPQYFFLSGDLTSIGNPKEFIYCEKKILSLAEQINLPKENIICGLGNHDIDWTISDLGEKNSNSNSEVDDLVCEKYQYIAANCAKHCFEVIPEPEQIGPIVFSGVTEREDFIVFVLNTGLFCVRDEKPSHGKVGTKQLEWFKKTAIKYKDDKRTKIVLMHHHPRNYSYPTPILDISTIEEGAEIMDIVNDNEIDIIIHGHRHHPHVETIQSASGHKPVSLICAGSLSVNAQHRSDGEIPNTIHFLDVVPGKDYYVLYNYQYTGPEGWKPLMYNPKITPLDQQMRIGKIIDEDCIKNAIEKYAISEEEYVTIKWEDLDECLYFKSIEEINKCFKKILSDKYQIVGDFPNDVALIRRGGD